MHDAEQGPRRRLCISSARAHTLELPIRQPTKLAYWLDTMSRPGTGIVRCHQQLKPASTGAREGGLPPMPAFGWSVTGGSNKTEESPPVPAGALLTLQHFF